MAVSNRSYIIVCTMSQVMSMFRKLQLHELCAWSLYFLSVENQQSRKPRNYVSHLTQQYYVCCDVFK